MKHFLLIVLTLIFPLLLLGQSFQDSLLLEENFYDTNGFVDLSQKLIWGENTDIESGFQYGEMADDGGLSFQSIHLTEEAMQYAGYQPGTIRGSQAIDFRFPNTISREQDTIIIEFDALWGAFNSNGWGESGRIVLALLHDYPEEEIPFGAIDDLSAETPFGRPAYNLRLRNTDLTGPYQSGAFMLYGGGHDVLGEVEKTNSYWLPGFSSEPGGGSPGLGAPYPLSPTQKNEYFPVASITNWQHYTWVIAPERLSFYMRDATAPPEDDALVFFMEIPRSDQWEGNIVDQINTAHGSDITDAPTLYHWFGEVEALRLYFRGVQQAYLANLQIKHIYEMTPVQVQELTVGPVVSVYPNPVNETFFIEFETPLSRDLELSLTNSSGQVIQSSQMEAAKLKRQFWVNDLPQGVYILKGTGLNNHFAKKIIIK